MRFYYITAFVLLSAVCYSQKQDNNWLLGQAPFNIIEFDDNSYNVFMLDSFDVNHRFQRTNAAISDSLGNLELYFTGQLLMNSYGDIVGTDSMFNQGFIADTWSEFAYGAPNSAVFLPQNDTIIDLFTVFGDTGIVNNKFRDFSSEVRRSVIQKNSLGFHIIEKETLILKDTFNLDGFGACKHGNGRDWWLVTTEVNGCLDIILSTPDSSYLWSKNCDYAGNDTVVFGSNVFNADGNKLVVGNGFYGVNVFDFDRCTGDLTNRKNILATDLDTLDTFIGHRFEGSVAFSPSSRFLYVATTTRLWQFDLEATDLLASGIIIHDNPGPPFTYGFTNMRLAPNGEIMIGTLTSLYHWHIIHEPDSIGSACDFEIMLPLPNSYGGYVPNFPNYRLGRLIDSPCDTLLSDTVDAVNSIEIENHLELYPNPAANQFRIEYGNFLWSSNDELSIVITNTLGQLVLETNLPKYSLYQDYNVSQWDSGLYWVSLYDNGVFVGVRKLVVE